jgi:asparagine synthase (glutamine-hydrolysing)
MCGIAGVLLKEERGGLDTLRAIRPMVQALQHRGPDGSGFYESSAVALGHRRLSIIDLSDNARQPMFNEDASLVLVFNGEIYNFRELREDLQKRGHRFRSAGDSEVILHLYEEHAEDCVTHLEGMFAFAIYDLKRRRVYLARDRVGEKPMYYYRDRSAFYFASEIKSFSAIPGFEKRLSKEGLLHFFNYIQIPAPHTILEGVSKLQAAHWMTVDASGQERVNPYWRLRFDRKEQISEEEATQRLSVLMRESVSKMLVSDVPLGLLLSGGVDSSLILALSKELGSDITAFTVRNTAPGVNDDEYRRAKAVASRFGVPIVDVDYGAPAFGELVDAVSKCDEPVGLLEIFYMFGVYKGVSEHAKVILTGNGADEVFGGYSGYTKLRSLAPSANPLASLIGASNPLINEVAGKAYVLRNGHFLRRILSSKVYSLARNARCSEPLSSLSQHAQYDNLLDARLFMDLMVLANHSISSIADCASMSNSVESRSPFLHHKVIEFAAKLPPELKVRNTTDPIQNKYVVKRLLSRYMDAKDVFVKKYGFGYFINTFDLMRNSWRENLEHELFDKQIADLGLFDRTGVATMWSRFLADALSFRERLVLVRYVMFCLWYRHTFSKLR